MAADGAAGGMAGTGAPVPFDTSVAHIARVYDYWLGGKDNFAADRTAGDQAIKAFPKVVLSARTNRAFLARAAAVEVSVVLVEARSQRSRNRRPLPSCRRPFEPTRLSDGGAMRPIISRRIGPARKRQRVPSATILLSLGRAQPAA